MKTTDSALDRRAFLVGSAAASAGILSAQSKPSADATRRVYELNRKWLFGGKTKAGVHAPEFDDSKWEKVVFPHSNARLPCHSFEEADRRHFPALAGWKGKRMFVDFAGAMTASTVFINGKELGEYCTEDVFG
jgi:beta-galactosidase